MRHQMRDRIRHHLRVHLRGLLRERLRARVATPLHGSPRSLLQFAGRFARAAWTRRAQAALVVLLLAGVLLMPALLLSGSGPVRSAEARSKAPLKTVAATAPRSPFSQTILDENERPGTTDWNVAPEHEATNEIQAYAGAPSVSPGGSLTFYVSVQQGGALYQIDIYRLGWYGGTGGRLYLHAERTGQAQGYYDQAKGRLVDCPSCYVDRTTGLAEANWQPSFALNVPHGAHGWPTGVYLAKFTEGPAAGGKATTVPFDVRGDPHSTYVVVTTDTTVQAYNEWGGASLYLARYALPDARASKVSFDRPVSGWGTAQGLLYEIDGIRWLEKNGYDVSYISSVDLHEHPGQLLEHRAFLDFGHDEYWSKEMRDGVERARDAGIGLGFIGANTAYWQIRFEPDTNGIADRTIICYKSARRDPNMKLDRSRLTVQWRDGWLAQPENALLGAMYSDWTSPPRAFPWRVSPGAPSWLLAGTGLQPGHSYGCDLVGYEWDKVYVNGYTPPGLKVLSVSAVASLDGRHDVSNTTYYVARSGALVFDAGSVKWDYALDSFRLVSDHGCGAQQNPVPEMQRLLANVLAALVIRQQP